jgi:hypothetical protein
LMQLRQPFSRPGHVGISVGGWRIIPSGKATKQYLGEESDDEDGR